MGKQALVRFPAKQFSAEELDPEEYEDERPIEFAGEFLGNQQGRLHVRIEPELDRAFVDKRANLFIPHSFNKEYRGVYVGDDPDGNAVFGEINRVGGGSLSMEEGE
jgi:hypothetical protein